MLTENLNLPPTFEEVQGKIKRWAEMIPQIKRVYFFGSFVRRKERPDDIDIAVEVFGGLDESDEVLFFADQEKELTQLLGYPVDLQELDGKFPTAQQYIAEDSVLIFERHTLNCHDTEKE